MAKPSTLKKKKRGKNTYWFARIRGKDCLFGNVKTTSRPEAEEAFGAALAGAIGWAAELAGIHVAKSPPSGPVTTVAQLYDDYLKRIKKTVTKKTADNKRCILKQWCQWTPGGSRLAIKDLPVTAVTRDHLLEYLDSRAEDDKLPKTLWHDVSEVKAMWNWGAGRNPDGPLAGYMPETHDPFRTVKKPTPDQRNLTADSLPTDEEVDHLLRNCKHEGFQPILKTIHQTGARPGELCNAKVRDFQPDTRTIVLYHHKNDGRRTGAKATPRVVPLSKAAFALVKEGCDGKSPDDPIFTGPMGAAWTPDRLGKKYHQMHTRLAADVREHITMYWLRHLWISEALRNGIPIATVAAAAGTSIKMIQQTYGHFYVADLVASADKVESARSARKRKTA